MKWKHPASAMRAYMSPKNFPNCWDCAHIDDDDEGKRWCRKQEKDPAPNESSQGPKQVCEEFIDEVETP